MKEDGTKDIQVEKSIMIPNTNNDLVATAIMGTIIKVTMLGS